MMDQLPLLPRRANANTTLDRDMYMSFDEWGHKLTTFAVESFGRLGVEGSYFIDQLAAKVVGGEGQKVDGEEGGVEGMPVADRLSHHTGHHFAEGVPLQATA